MFRVLSTPIIRSTLTASTASGTGHTSVQLPSSNVAKFELVLKNMDILYDTLWYFSVFPLDLTLYRDADRSLARPGRKQVQTWPRWE